MCIKRSTDLPEFHKIHQAGLRFGIFHRGKKSWQSLPEMVRKQVGSRRLLHSLKLTFSHLKMVGFPSPEFPFPFGSIFSGALSVSFRVLSHPLTFEGYLFLDAGNPPVIFGVENRGEVEDFTSEAPKLNQPRLTSEALAAHSWVSW